MFIEIPNVSHTCFVVNMSGKSVNMLKLLPLIIILIVDA